MSIREGSHRVPSRRAVRLAASAAWILLAVGASTLVRFAIAPLIADSLAYTTYFPSILLVTAFLGWRAGIATLLISALIATYVFLPPAWAFSFDRTEFVATSIFIACATIVVLAASYLRTALVRIEDRRRLEADRRTNIQNSLNNSMMMVLGVGFHISRRVLDPKQFYELLAGRISALARGLDVLSEGEGDSCRFPDLAERVLEPFGLRQRFYMTGDPVALPPESCAPLALVLHELATNALKYGALSNADGEILLSWGPVADEAAQLMIRWEEWGGPPVAKPRRRGLGSHLLERQPGLADLNLAFDPQGVACDIKVDLSTLSAG